MQGAAVIWAVLWRDLRVELRGRELLPALAQFIVLALVISNFAFNVGSGPSLNDVGAGILWLVLVFAGVVAFTRAFAGEREHGSLDAMLLTPASAAAILTGKALASAVFLIACEVVLLPATAIFLGLDLRPSMFLIVLLAIVGMASLGSLFSALATQTRARELLLPVLALPLWIPFVIVGSGLVQQTLRGAGIQFTPLLLLCYMDILVL
ncbi:MAG: heme exporter protein CcmB, partial [Candidatus Dormiibacterota bacterium]